METVCGGSSSDGTVKLWEVLEFISRCGEDRGTQLDSLELEQHDQLYTWAAVSQPPPSLERLEGRLPEHLKNLWPLTRPGAEDGPLIIQDRDPR